MSARDEAAAVLANLPGLVKASVEPSGTLEVKKSPSNKLGRKTEKPNFMPPSKKRQPRTKREKNKHPLPVYAVPPVVIQILSKPREYVDHSYKDFSLVPPEPNDEPFPSSIDGMTFAQKLHHILSVPEFSEYISFLPHGRSFMVLSPPSFEKKVCPMYFGNSRYSSFLRTLNKHGFKQITKGNDRKSYYHECFLQGMEHLCKYIVESKDTRRLLPDPESEPDFWAISRVYPLKKHTKSLPENVPVCAQPSVFTHNMVLSALSSLQPRLCSTGWMEELLPPAKRLVTQDLGRSVTFGMLPPSTVLDLNPSSSSSSTSTSLSAALSQNRQVSLRERLLLEQQELQPVAQQKTSVIEALRQCRRSPVKDRSPYKSPPFVATSSRPSAIGDWLRQHTQKR